jgi:hypothetical protein
MKRNSGMRGSHKRPARLVTRRAEVCHLHRMPGAAQMTDDRAAARR